MTLIEDDMNIYQKLNAARIAFHELKLTKTGNNKFAGYKYFELGDFLIPALKVFSDVGICANVSFDAEKASMIIRNADNPEEYITIYSPMGSAALKGCHEVQNIGAVETYQRRYLWVAALEIVEHDAIDATSGASKPKTVAKDTAEKMEEEGDERLSKAKEAAAECLACLPDEIAFYRAYEAHKTILDADTQVVMWGLLYGDDSPFTSANSVKTALKNGKAAFEQAELIAQA
jgi:hypothetical protein